jgi:thioredoxin-like negative regulator of GroEL
LHQQLKQISAAAQALPTLLLFRDGKAVDRIEGVMPEASLLQRLRFYIGRLDLKFGRR